VAGVIGRSLDAQWISMCSISTGWWTRRSMRWRSSSRRGVRPRSSANSPPSFPTTLAATAGEVVGVADILGYGIGAGQGMELGPPAPGVWSGGRVMTVRSPRARRIGRSPNGGSSKEEAFVLDWAARGIDPTQTRSNRYDTRPLPDRGLERPAGSGRCDRRHRTRRARGRAGRDGQDHRDATRPSSSSTPMGGWCSVSPRRRSPRRC
jgi:hypothetical protein